LGGAAGKVLGALTSRFGQRSRLAVTGQQPLSKKKKTVQKLGKKTTNYKTTKVEALKPLTRRKHHYEKPYSRTLKGGGVELHNRNTRATIKGKKRNKEKGK